MAPQPAARLWCHIGPKVDVAALIAALVQLCSEAPDLHVSLSGSRGVALPDDLPPDLKSLPRPPDILRPMAKFLGQVNPDIVVFAGDGVPTSAVLECREKGIPTIWVNAVASPQSRFRDKLTGFRASPRYRMLDRVLAVSGEDAAELTRRGLPNDCIEVAGALEHTPALPGFDESEWEHVSRAVSTRPVWLAMGVARTELPDVLDAYRHASRIAHRLLLVLAPSDLKDIEDHAEHLRAAGLSFARRSLGEDPEEETRVLLADDEDEDGLWYRLAPVTYLGGTLSEAGNRHPFHGASLGSAMIIGSQIAEHRGAVAQLVAAKACRSIANGPDLARAVEDLLAPDRAALLAGRAWEVVSQGAQVEARVVDAILRMIPGQTV